MNEDILQNVGDLLTNNETTTSVTTTEPTQGVSPIFVVGGAVLILGVLGFLIYKFS